MKRHLPSAVPAASVLLLVVFLIDGTSSTASPASPVSLEPSPAALTEPLPDPFEEMPVEVIRKGDALPMASSAVPGRVSFLLRVRDVTVPYPLLAISALPGELLDLRVSGYESERAAGSFRLRTEEGLLPPETNGTWRWRVPEEPGVYPVRIESPLDGEAVHLNVMVLHPFDYASARSLNGYRIGEYRTGPGRALPPEGFIEASDEMLDLLVSPHFTLGQFLCKQPGDPPYLALSEPLLLKLEAILEEVRASGIEAETLHVMSAFRTPHYNRAIGNTTIYSRHLWGDAADIFIDTTGNGWMDDLDGDGRVDAADAAILYEIIERVDARNEPHVRAGGLSLYRPNAVRGPFIHVDTRGADARW